MTYSISEKISLATTIEELDALRAEVAADCHENSTRMWQEKYRDIKRR